MYTFDDVIQELDFVISLKTLKNWANKIEKLTDTYFVRKYAKNTDGRSYGYKVFSFDQIERFKKLISMREQSISLGKAILNAFLFIEEKEQMEIIEVRKKVKEKETIIEELPEVQEEKQKNDGRVFNEQFLEAYFTYKDLETREAFSVPMLTKACSEELKLGVYDKDFPAKSYLVSHESYYANEKENELVSLNSVEVTTIMNQVQTTITSTYRINLKKISGNWLIDHVEFLGSQIK